MKLWDNGKIRELKDDEVQKIQEKMTENAYQNRIRPRTKQEVIDVLCKFLLTKQMSETEDKTLGIVCMALFDTWEPGNYSVGDVRTDPKTGYPYECILSHDSISNPDWTINERTLWKAWHSREAEYALPWVQPTGAHDVYKAGEYMIWTDKKVKKCLQDTNFSPEEYPAAWEEVDL